MKEVKICGLWREEDIETVNRLRPDYCGFVINFPKSHRNVSAERVRVLRAKLSDGIKPVGVFVDQPVEFVAELLNGGVIAAAQLHGGENEDYIARLRILTDGVIWKAFQVRSVDDVKRAEESTADFVLLDAGQGTGKVFDWSMLRGFSRPFGLAGGLNLGNLSEALRTECALLDVSGGVETDKVKDPAKIEAFLRTVRETM